MSLPEILLLIVAGFLGGAINSIAGGGSLVVFPAMLGTGMSPLVANVTNSVSQWPGYFGGVIGFWPDLKDQKHRTRQVAGAAIVGSAIGCVLLLTLPGSAFDAIVPALVIAAGVLLAFQPRLKKWAAARQETAAGEQKHPVAMIFWIFLGAIYGGYFGGALGVIILALLALTVPDTLRRNNALKSSISLVVSSVTVVAFAIFGPVQWIAVAIVAPMALIGGVVGARFARKIREDILRWVVVVLSFAVAAYLVVRAIRGS
ncbi:hypothetical protein CLV47_11037 [Antricoccus suffuscus]|uniref:Probable membrane transporter protein n=1 Tax=Antricoccus suffuscus TaxID=1629062 RepID=A0A2T0ZY81_9ACTN|nr:sulfite exporter TauE/SafE family protein [Antricoccus suffuscus]PRZ41311.1 hypothetical protein CLV47_11037 [Antricoccus suffuscus]